MNREIERKFLVHTDRLPELGEGEALVQGYLAFQPSVRVRSAKARAWLTIKGPGQLERAEYEYEIPIDDARGLLQLCAATLTKIRRHVTVGEHVWDLDQFTGAHDGLWLAEVELSAVDEAFARPPWLGAEVTDDPRYTNAALARAGRPPMV
jgi:CYTH domain-containing protein